RSERGTSRASAPNCWRGWGPPRDEGLTALAAAGGGGSRGLGDAHAAVARRAARAAAAAAVPRAAGGARGGAQPRPRRRDRGAAAGARGERVQRHAAAR